MSAPETNEQTQQNPSGCLLKKRINDDKDVAYFKTQSPAYRNILAYVDALCELIKGTGNRVYNHKYQIKSELFKRCAEFLGKLEKCCDETDLNSTKSTATLRFGHVAFRDWFDNMAELSRDFTHNQLAAECQDAQLKDELYTYLIESFGNKMRIDYGTGHELNFVIFTMGLSHLFEDKPPLTSALDRDKLKQFVSQNGWDILWLFARHYLRLCRRLQIKFRLEPAGSRGVYNMDDFQFLPFLFGAAQLTGTKHVSCKQFYEFDLVDMYKSDYIFLEAVEFILNNKRGPFNEHSYTLWGFSSLASWETILNRIKYKFTDDILSPFPIVQHLLFGKYILNWAPQDGINAANA